jgi:DtxR family Mn-dependent transcriptional regulator
MAAPVRERLSDLLPGQCATVAEVNDHDSAVLRYLGELGLYPGARVEVVSVAPFNGPLTVRLAGVEHALGREVAAFVSVAAIEAA